MTDTTDFLFKLGSALRQARVHAGYTQEDLAKALHVTPATVARYELGIRRVPIHTLLQIADVIGQPLSQILPHTNPRSGSSLPVSHLSFSTATQTVIHLLQQRPDLAPKVLQLIEASLQEENIHHTSDSHVP